MQLRKHISILGTLVFVLATVFSCANPTGPNGGERDTKGPEIIGIIPEIGTINFNYPEVEFYFDEFLKPGNYQKEIFISPVPAVDPTVTVKNKRLKIRFNEPLRENTTYVITLGTGIADFNESNKMEKSFTYAFSTGGVLDSLKLSGNVRDVWSQEAEKDMKVLLFRAEDVQENDIAGLRPEYVCVTDKNGNFDFQYLAAGRYKIYGIEDQDNNFKYGGRGERIALAKDPLIVLPNEDSIPKKINMLAFMEDLRPAAVKSAKWNNDYTIHVEFSEEIRTKYKDDSLRIELMDTLASNVELVKLMEFRSNNRRHLYLHSPKPRIHDYDLRITNLMDSTGLKGDTTLRLLATSQVKEEREKYFDKPINLPKGNDLLIPALFLVNQELDSSKVQLLDSSGAYVTTLLKAFDFGIRIRPIKNLDPNIEYTVRISPTIEKPDGFKLDTLIEFKVQFPNPDDFGTISGKVLPDSARPDAKFVVIFRGKPGTANLVEAKKNADDKKGNPRGKSAGGDDGVKTYFEQRFAAPSEFRFVYLHAGKYTIDIIDDEDGNGILTPGSLKPYRMPEKVYHQSEQIDIRAKWDLENVLIYPIPMENIGKGGKSADSNPVPDDNNTPEESPKNPKGK